MPAIQLTEDAEQVFLNYHWPGNIRQLKNITEQISIIEKERVITAEMLKNYLNLNTASASSPIRLSDVQYEESILKSAVFELKKEVDQLKKIVYGLVDIVKQNINITPEENNNLPVLATDINVSPAFPIKVENPTIVPKGTDKPVIPIEETLSLQDKEKELIKKALIKHKGKRRPAAKELGISERTLYRKIQEYNLKDI